MRNGLRGRERWAPTGGEAGRRIEVKECEGGVCEGLADEGTPFLVIFVHEYQLQLRQESKR